MVVVLHQVIPLLRMALPVRLPVRHLVELNMHQFWGFHLESLARLKVKVHHLDLVLFLALDLQPPLEKGHRAKHSGLL